MRRLIAVFLAGVLLAVLPSLGLQLDRPVGVPAVAADVQPAADTLDADPASTPSDTLPVPYPHTPDGTLQIPTETEAETPTDLETLPPSESAGTAAEGNLDNDPEGNADSDIEGLLADLDPEVAKTSRLLIEADRLFVAGDVAGAEPLYRQAKDDKWAQQADLDIRVQPILDPAELPPAGAVYWREAQAGAEAGASNRTRVALGLLVDEYPEFLPGQILYARYLVEHDQRDEAVDVLQAAVARYPTSPDLLQVQTEVYMAQEHWIEAAITAQQFTILNPDHPNTPAMAQAAQDNLERFRAEMNQALTGNLLANIITGAAGYLLTGGLLGPFSAINSTMALLQGEAAVGEQVASQVRSQVPLAEDPDIRAYVDTIGQRMAVLAGRQEFNYSFDVVMDDSLNAFALPGGKIFVNAGALLKTYSEAELAGLIGHEISHAVLSHGFQMVTQGNLTNSLAAFIPIPEVASIAANLAVSSYSREMERQADVLGTQLLAADQYAADGLYNLMSTLHDETGGTGASWFASHPATGERLGYLKQLVDQGGFSRYAYEGVETHLRVRQKMDALMIAFQRDAKTQPNP